MSGFLSNLFGVRDDGGPVAVLEGTRRKATISHGLGAPWWVGYGRNTKGCIEAFLSRKRCRVASISSDGTKLYSYAMQIGEWLNADTLAVDCHRRSVTTSRAQNRLLRMAREAGVQVVCSPDPAVVKLRRRAREI